MVYSLTVNFAKLALFLLYFRIFATNRRNKIAIHLGILANCCFYIGSSIILLVLCVPRSDESWLSPVYAARCRQTTKMGIIQGVFGLLSDLYIFILPLPILWRLQMPLRRKLGITAIFLTGLMYSLPPRS